MSAEEGDYCIVFFLFLHHPMSGLIKLIFNKLSLCGSFCWFNNLPLWSTYELIYSNVTQHRLDGIEEKVIQSFSFSDDCSKTK